MVKGVKSFYENFFKPNQTRPRCRCGEPDAGTAAGRTYVAEGTRRVLRVHKCRGVREHCWESLVLPNPLANAGTMMAHGFRPPCGSGSIADGRRGPSSGKFNGRLLTSTP